MAYHPQTDGASERTNQMLEQYLHVFCGAQQNNWHAWLPLAQYTKNSWPSATTKKTPFDLLIGYTPQIHQPTRKTDIPSIQQWITKIEEARRAAQEVQRKAQDSWIKDCPHYIPFTIGLKVWLEGTNLRLPANATTKLAPRLSRTESTTSCIQRNPSPSSSKATPKPKYSHVVKSTLQPCDPGKPSHDLSCVQSCDTLTTLGSCDIQARDPGKVSHDLPRDWSSTQSQVTPQSPDCMRFRRMPSLLIGMWKTMGTINESMNQQTSHKTLEHSKVAHPLPVFVPALKYGLPIWVCMPALNMYAQTTLY